MTRIGMQSNLILQITNSGTIKGTPWPMASTDPAF
jgi:hypothetical protein